MTPQIVTLGLCYNCFTDLTFQYHGMTENYNTEMERYKNSLTNGMIVECTHCDRKVVYDKMNDGSWYMRRLEE